MNIKELILEGCRITMPYKDEPNQWVGETKIYIFGGGCGCKPKLIVEGDYCNGYRKEFEVSQIDEAIQYFNEHAFNPKNIMYKMNPAMVLASTTISDIDLDDVTDFLIVEKIKLKLISDNDKTNKS